MSTKARKFNSIQLLMIANCCAIIALFALFIIFGNIPSQLSKTTAQMILTTVISVEGILIGFMIVALFFIAGEYGKSYISSFILQIYMSGFLEMEGIKPEHRKIMEEYKQKSNTQNQLPNSIFLTFIINLIMMSINIFIMLFSLAIIDAEPQVISTSLTNVIYLSFTLLAINIGLVLISFMYCLIFIKNLADVQSIETYIKEYAAMYKRR